jgi:hypothetical protein
MNVCVSWSILRNYILKKKIKYFPFSIISISFLDEILIEVPHFINLVQRSTTSIKTQEDLHHREVVISVLTDSSVDKFEASVSISKGCFRLGNESTASDHRTIFVGTSPTQNFPFQ